MRTIEIQHFCPSPLQKCLESSRTSGFVATRSQDYKLSRIWPFLQSEEGIFFCVAYGKEQIVFPRHYKKEFYTNAVMTNHSDTLVAHVCTIFSADYSSGHPCPLTTTRRYGIASLVPGTASSCALTINF